MERVERGNEREREKKIDRNVSRLCSANYGENGAWTPEEPLGFSRAAQHTAMPVTFFTTAQRVPIYNTSKSRRPSNTHWNFRKQIFFKKMYLESGVMYCLQSWLCQRCCCTAAVMPVHQVRTPQNLCVDDINGCVNWNISTHLACVCFILHAIAA